MEAIRQELVIQVFNFFLQNIDVPLPSNLFFDSSFSSTPRSWVPITNTEPSLFGQPVGQDVECFLVGAARNAALTPFYIDSVTPQGGHEVRVHPCQKAISHGRDVFLIYPDKISSSRYGNANRLGKGPNSFG